MSARVVNTTENGKHVVYIEIRQADASEDVALAAVEAELGNALADTKARRKVLAATAKKKDAPAGG